ncbi:MAG TPA: choice-of-anchor tandem repeat GloVer-containing protein [Tepidisphaeraceae bacterium]|jgi:hypothetical protein|nr:choice-of-anchor tandem repeat GloVer-containing protein [Tepidisphaeraceae bacterium]
MKLHRLPGRGFSKRHDPRRRRAISSAIVDLLESRVLLNGMLSPYASFNGTNGEGPVAVVQDSSGNLFGVTSYSLNGSTTESGVLFEVPASTGQIVDLATLGNGSAIVQGTSLIIDSSGNLFGTENGGPAGGGCTVFEVAQGSSSITPLATFPLADPTGAIGSQGVLSAVDSSGNVYGVDDSGNAIEVASGSGTISDIAGEFGVSELLLKPALGPDGNFYGYSHGSIIELSTTTHTVMTLAPFDQTALGSGPLGITFDSNGNIWGVSQYGPGGSQVGNGTVWELPVGQNTISLISTFDATTGYTPISAPVFGISGNLYGLAELGGANQDGTLFEIPGVGSTTAGVAAPTTAPVDLADLDDSENVSSGAGIVTDSAGMSQDSSPTIMSSLADDRLFPASPNVAGTSSTTIPGVIIYGNEFTPSGEVTVLSAGGMDKLTPQNIKNKLADFEGQEIQKKNEMQDREDLIGQVDQEVEIFSMLGKDELHVEILPSDSQTTVKSLESQIRALLTETGTELNAVSPELSKQMQLTNQYNKLGTALNTLNAQLTAQTKPAAQAKIQAKITVDENSQNDIITQDNTIYDATAANLATIGTQLDSITGDLAMFPPRSVAFSGSVASVPKAIVPGKTAVFLVAVTNSGNVTALGPLAVALSARPAGTAGDADIALPTASAKIHILAGKTRKARLTFIVPDTLPAGSYTLDVQLDPDNLFEESVVPGLISGTQTFMVT